MQQTTKYQFKLIEGSDDFSPQPLNDNVEKMEEVLTELDTAIVVVQSAMDEVADAFTPDNLPYVTGSYTGDGSTANRTITLGFKPKFVITTGTSRSTSYEAEALTRFGLIGPGASGTIAGLTNTGFVISNGSFQYPQLNVSGCTYGYVAFK